ncbi:type VI secretion system Vgr family protein [Herbaspirillum huttiense]|jgi:type VI secretion system secreted protein VgrG|uniref:Type VI secretion system tip protein TssI/VgrG n=2 Tax=Herbaspirillum huttiense TaxID=863372 RepID=A0AAJ2H779_9BURK|nr:type VI secretion system tip protein TssI/VgrG [Herbaspirillum huttiense]MDR9838147.1 type VI secretion system tip protein TssI/VgrG [Herbaspirillum huttiense]
MHSRTTGWDSLTRQRQHHRILQLHFVNDDAPDVELLINHLNASEALSRDYAYTLELLSDDAYIPLEALMGKLLRVALVRADGTQRHFTGYVERFSFLRTDGGIAFYEARLVPWMAFLAARTNNRIFHQRNLEGLSAEIFSAYPTHARWDCQLRHDDPVRTDMFQFDESDSNLLHRRWEDAGWHYHYEHQTDGHQLRLSDDSTYAKPIDGGGQVPFQHHGGAIEEDGMAQWSMVRRFQPSSTRLSSYDFKTARPQQVDVPTLNKQGAVLPVEHYEYTGAYGFSNLEAGDRQSRVRMEEFEAAAQLFEGKGNCRYLQPGRSFRLTGHFSEHLAVGGDASAEDQEFLIISVEHSASNNYLQDAETPPFYANHVRCARKLLPWRPGRGYTSQPTVLHGMQTATVVGPSGENLHVDEYGRVKVQFHWDLQGRNDEHSTAWIRVASSWAGAEQGLVAVPRIGQLVIVQWLGGHPDRPIITGSVVNQLNMPPWALPSQAALSGLRSRELAPGAGNAAGGRSGHVLFDDTHEAIQTQVRSDAFDSQLALGHVTRIERHAGRQDARGAGFELRTDAHGVVRAAQGLLLTSEPRPKARGHMTDIAETAGRLAQAQGTVASLSKLAQEHQAQDKNADQHEAAQAIQSQNEAINGQGGAQDGRFPELADPHLVLSSPCGIEASSGASTHLASAEHAALTAGSHVSLAAGKSFFASAAEKLSLLAYRLGAKLIAASGRVEIQAQNDGMEILAQKVVDIISTRDWINLKAKKGIRLNGGGSELVIAEGITGFTQGAHHVHASDHQTLGPQAKPAEFPGAQLCPSRASGAAQSGSASVALS